MHITRTSTTEQRDIQNAQRRCLIHTSVLLGAGAVWLFNAYGFAVSLFS